MSHPSRPVEGAAPTGGAAPSSRVRLRPRAGAFLAAVVGVVLALVQFASGPASADGTVEFGYTGYEDTWFAPSGVSTLTLTVEGAQGGYNGGLGAKLTVTVAVSTGDPVTFKVGGRPPKGSGGWPGGGDAGYTNQVCWGGGGGYTEVSVAGQLVAIAGGGGGDGCSTAGGGGGGLAGIDGSSFGAAGGGGGGTATAGGPAGSSGCGNSATAGGSRQGGKGAIRSGFGAGGGGGGGYYGGGGGGFACDTSGSGGGGGGGSSWVASGVISWSAVPASRTGNGRLLIAWGTAPTTTTAPPTTTTTAPPTTTTIPPTEADRPDWCPQLPQTGDPWPDGLPGFYGGGPLAVELPAEPVSEEAWNGCIFQPSAVRFGSSWPVSAFDFGNGLNCQAVITEGSWLAGLDESASWWTQFGTWLNEEMPLLYDALDSLTSEGMSLNSGEALFGVTCWIPPPAAADLIPATSPPYDGSLEFLMAELSVPGDPWSSGTTSICQPSARDGVPGSPQGMIIGGYPRGSPSHYHPCFFTMLDSTGDVSRIHWVGTMSEYEVLLAARTRLAVRIWGASPGINFSHLNGGGKCVDGWDRACPMIRLQDQDVEVGVARGDGSAPPILPNPPEVPGWVDPNMLAACRVIKFTGDNIASTTWAGGELVKMKGEWLDGVTRTDSFTARLDITLGEINGQAVRVQQTVMLPGEFVVQVPSPLPGPLKPAVVIDMSTDGCSNSLYYDPTGAGGAPGSADGRMGFQECIDTGLDGTFGSSSWWTVDGVAENTAKYLICGLYVLGVPSKGFDWYLADAKQRASGSAIGDLLAVWQSGAQVVDRVKSSAQGPGKAGAPIKLGQSSVSIPTLPSAWSGLLSLALSILVYVGGAQAGWRLIMAAWNGRAASGAGRESGGGGDDE